MASLKDRYASALIKLSQETASLENDLDQAIIVRDALSEDYVQPFLLHPHIPDSTKYELFNKAFSQNISNHFMGFLHLVVRKNREAFIVPALEEYIVRAKKLLGKMEAEVVSAKILTKEQIESIRLLLSKQTNMDIEITCKIDPDVIGGYYILINGHIFDGTVRNRLNNMKEHLKRGGYE